VCAAGPLTDVEAMFEPRLAAAPAPSLCRRLLRALCAAALAASGAVLAAALLG
jgi:hypothetical protein